MARHCMISSLGGPRVRNHDSSKSHQENVEAMKSFWHGQLKQVLADRPDLVVVPEASDRYSSMPLEERHEYYLVRGGQLLDFWRGIAVEHRTCVAYSASRQLEDGTWRNSTQIIGRDGAILGIYDKNHLVIEETTKSGVLCGKDAMVATTDFGTVGCAICFDLNFEEIRKRYEALQPDVLAFCSMYHGGLMQGYWAYVCRTHFVGCICGDENTIINPVGEVIARSTNYFNFVSARVNLDCKVCHLDYNWGKMKAMKDKYGRGVTIFDPGHLGAVLITCEKDDMTIDQMLDEFEIERWDDYFARAMKHRAENTEA